jgi:micrococcal nuclease
MGSCCSTNEKEILSNCTISNTPEFSLLDRIFYAKVLRVIDGDTIVIACKPETYIYKFKCRLNGIDCPETKSKDENERADAKCATEYLAKSILGKVVYIKGGKWDKYGRLLVTVFLDKNKQSLNDEMIQLGYACAYDGKKKKLYTSTIVI